jgi:ribosome assembly protein 4
MVSGSKDGSLRVWAINSHNCILSLTSHTRTVRSVRWGGEGWIYSASADGSIKIWSSENGKLLNSFNSHGHWVNTLSLSTDYVLKTGFFELNNQFEVDKNISMEKKVLAQWRYDKMSEVASNERLVSGSDDLTLFLWIPKSSKVPKALLIGHQKPINHVGFSPNGLLIVSSSFDNSIKLWNGVSGQFLKTLSGHIAPVYMCSWSPDSKLIISASKDSMLKVWDIDRGLIIENLHGHTDEVFAVEWSPDGSTVTSGSKDRSVILWRY